MLRNRLVNNGLRFFNSTSLPTINAVIQNTPKFNLGNNYISSNYGGFLIKLYSGSGVLITNSIIYNNIFNSNFNDTILSAFGEVELPYNDLLIDKNIFIDNQTPRSKLIAISGLLSKFTRNQVYFTL